MKPYYVRNDFLIMFVKILISFYFFLSQGLIYGTIVYFVFWTIYYRVLKHLFNMDGLASLDEFFLLDNEKNRANIITVVKLDKI